MSLRDRIGIDVGRRLRLEEALEWAAEHEVRWIDIQLDAGANALSSFDDARAAGVRRACERYGVHLSLHTASAVNVAEVAQGDERRAESVSRADGGQPNGTEKRGAPVVRTRFSVFSALMVMPAAAASCGWDKPQTH